MAMAFAAGDYHSLAVKNDGTVVLWGDDSRLSASSSGSCKCSRRGGGGSHSLALKSDGTLAAWGANWNGQCDIFPGLTNAPGLLRAGTIRSCWSWTARSRRDFSDHAGMATGLAPSRKHSAPGVYGLDYKTSLTATSWSRSLSFPATGALRMLTDTSAARQRLLPRPSAIIVTHFFNEERNSSKSANSCEVIPCCITRWHDGCLELAAADDVAFLVASNNSLEILDRNFIIRFAGQQAICLVPGFQFEAVRFRSRPKIPALGSRMASTRASLPSFVPISDRSGPICAPLPLTRWQVKQPGA